MYKSAYCSNVHAGANLHQTRANLEEFTSKVKHLFSPDADMGVGLWLSAQSATELISDRDQLDVFKDFLRTNGLDPFTFNGFPYGNFHQEVVKRDVYVPTWYDEDRLRYTENLARLIDALAGPGPVTISTLPIAWGNPTPARGHLAEAGRLLRELAETLSRIEMETGRLIRVCIEPEPGCVIQFSKDLVNFFHRHLIRHDLEYLIRRHICVCHDVCHAVVMCEPQQDVLRTYQSAGIEVGKVQVSSAVVVDFDTISGGDRAQALQQLTSFAEDRYLHQTSIQTSDGTVYYYDDLPFALRTADDPNRAEGTWRIHFHIPVYLSRFGFLNGSQQEIVDCLSRCRNYSKVEHFEVETYAWNVLPDELRQDDLPMGIADELKWFSELAAQHLS